MSRSIGQTYARSVLFGAVEAAVVLAVDDGSVFWLVPEQAIAAPTTIQPARNRA